MGRIKGDASRYAVFFARLTRPLETAFQTAGTYAYFPLITTIARFDTLIPRPNLLNMDCRHLITIEPDKRSGQACIRELRMSVRDVLEYLAAGMTPAQIVDDFPDLTLEDIQACLAYAADRERRLWTVPAA